MKTREIKTEQLEKSISSLGKWVEDHEYKSYEPFDGLSSFLHGITFNCQFAERILQQVVLRSPLNIRPLIGIKPKESTKGRGYMARGYLSMMSINGFDTYRQNAVNNLNWLMKNKAPGYEEYSWGNHFPFSSRAFQLKSQEPIIVWSSLIGQSFLDAFELLGNIEYLDVSRSICRWILSLPRESTSQGFCISYIYPHQISIHNSNMLGAALLARTALFAENTEYLDVAKQAMEYSCSRQLENGAWYYGEEPKYHWIDNFHTGYNLVSLKTYMTATGDGQYRDNLTKGFTYFKNTFFEENGAPRYYHNSTYPIDIQCAAQAIETLNEFIDIDPQALDLAYKVASWTISNMQDKNGFFYYRVLPYMKVKTPMLHWGQATMYRALTALLRSIQ